MIAIQLAGGNWFAEFWESFLRQLAERFQIGDIGEEINHGILQWQHTFFDIQSIPVVLTDAIIVTWIAVIAILQAVLVMRLLQWQSSRSSSLSLHRSGSLGLRDSGFT